MNVLITLTEAGIDTGPFNLYSNVDNYSTPFDTNISRGILIAGYTSQVVPTGTSTIRVKSIGTCTNYVDLAVITPTTTTTSTSTTAVPATTTTTTTSGGGPTTTTTTTPYVGPSTTTTTTTPYVGPTTTTTTTPYVGPSTTTTTTTPAPGTTTTTTTSGGGSTTTTTTTPAPVTTTTTTTSLVCYTYNGQNNNLESATIFWTNCDGTSGSEVVAPSAFSSNFCAREGSVSGFNFTINTIEPCSVPGPTTTTTTTTAAPVTTTTTTTLTTYYQYSLCTDSGVQYYTANSGYPSMILIAGQCFAGGSPTTSPVGTEFFANDGTCDCG